MIKAVSLNRGLQNQNNKPVNPKSCGKLQSIWSLCVYKNTTCWNLYCYKIIDRAALKFHEASMFSCSPHKHQLQHPVRCSAAIFHLASQWESAYTIIALFGNFKHLITFCSLETFRKWGVLRFMLANSVFLTVIMPPFLTLRGLRLLFNQPVCMNHGAWSPLIVSTACCLPACCEPDTTSWGPCAYTQIWWPADTNKTCS